MPAHVWAHAGSTASLRSVASDAVPGLTLEWHVAWRDLDAVAGLDTDHDGRLTWAEAQAAAQRLEALAARSFLPTAPIPDAARQASQGGQGNVGAAQRSIEKESQVDCPWTWRLTGSRQRADVGYAVLPATLPCGPPRHADVAYRFLAAIDPTHRLLVALPGEAPRFVEPGDPLALQARGAGTAAPPAAAPHSAWDFLVEGMLHILRGADHVIFVLTLVLPLALAARHDELRPALRRLLAVITSFTLAHSVTLALASLRLWNPPADIVEPAIAASIAIAALYNLIGRKAHASVLVAFAFGLLHGFGFAEVLQPLDLPAAELAAALGLFNLGVEAGQLLVVAPAIAMLLALRRLRPSISRAVHAAGSAGFAAFASVWFFERIG